MASLKRVRDVIYLVKWHDAQSVCSWTDNQDFDEFKQQRMIITEVGWIAHEDKDVVILCSQITSDGDMGNMTKIPKGMILSRKKIV